MPNAKNLNLVIIEASENDAESLANVLRSAGHSIKYSHASNPETFENCIKQQQPDLVLCGIHEEASNSGNICDILKKHNLTTPVITITDAVTEELTASALANGVKAAVSKGLPANLQMAVQTEAEKLVLKRELEIVKTSLNECENRCHHLIENSSDAIAYIHEGMHVFANQPYLDMFGITSLEDMEGTPVLDMISAKARDSFRDFLRCYRDSTSPDNTLTIDCNKPDGESFESLMELTSATMKGEPCIQLLIRPRTSSTELEQKIEVLSRQDLLTGLDNRQHFMKILEDTVSKDSDNNEERALVYILIDNFKTIREDYGIAASDMVLCDMAHLIESAAGSRDKISRFGEHAFAVLHHSTSKEKIQAFSEKLLHEIASHISEVEGKSITTTGSIGICAINEHSENAQAVLWRADLACDVARSSGGNRIHTHSTAVDEHMELDQEGDDAIRKTIEDERFYLVYQPIVSLKGDTSQRYEVLLRVVDEEGNVILPGQFLSIAEKTGLSSDIDRWIIDNAFKQLTLLRQDGRDVSFFIKLSGSTLTDASLPAWIKEKLREYRLVSDGIVFEISETIASNDLKNSMTFIKAMQQLNCKVALEHFGCSNQPQILKHLHVDVLKIDGSLIEGVASSKDNQEKVKSLVELARSYEKLCVAERVDDAGDLAILWQYGMDLIQGNFVQEPHKELEYDFQGEIA